MILKNVLRFCVELINQPKIGFVFVAYDPKRFDTFPPEWGMLRMRSDLSLKIIPVATNQYAECERRHAMKRFRICSL